MAQNSSDTVARRRANVARLYLQGWTQAQIGQQEGVDQSQISLDLKEIRKMWLASTVLDFNEAKIQELQKIDLLEATYWQAWADSKAELKRKSTRLWTPVPAGTPQEDKKNLKPETIEQYNHTENRLGDPRILKGINDCIALRCKILGLEAPLKVAETDTEGKSVTPTARAWVKMDFTGGRPVPAPDDDYSSPTN